MTWDNDWDMNAPFGMTRSKVDSQRSLLQAPHYTQVNQTLGYNVDTVKDLSRVIEDDEIRRHISVMKKEFMPLVLRERNDPSAGPALTPEQVLAWADYINSAFAARCLTREGDCEHGK